MSRNTTHGRNGSPAVRRFYWSKPGLQMVCTNHESRDTNHDLYVRSVRRCCARAVTPGTAARTPETPAESMLYCPLLPIFYCKLLRTSALGGEGYVHRSSHRQPLWMGLAASAVSGEIPESMQNPVSPRKMREAQRPSRLPSPPGLDPLRRPQNVPMPGSH